MFKLQQKKSWIARDFIIAGLLFSGIVALFVIMVAGVESEYPGTNLTSDSFSANYDRLTQTSDIVDVARNETSGGSGLSFRGTFDVAYSSTFTTIQLIFSTLGLFGDMSDNVVNDFTFLDSTGIKIFFTVLLSMVTIVIVLVIFSSISRSKV